MYACEFVPIQILLIFLTEREKNPNLGLQHDRFGAQYSQGVYPDCGSFNSSPVALRKALHDKKNYS